jgi:integrase
MAAISTVDIRSYIAARQADTTIVRKAYEITRKDGSIVHVPEQRRTVSGISNAEINRELTTLKRMFSLAVQASKLLHKPHIPLLRENNTRTGFFEREQFLSVSSHLVPALRPVIEFAYITGWRIASEVLPLEWRQIDFAAGEVRLDPGTTKNSDGRVFPMTDDLRRLLERQHYAHVQLKKAGQIEPWVFWRMVAEGRRGPLKPRRIHTFAKAWQAACANAGCPGLSLGQGAAPMRVRLVEREERAVDIEQGDPLALDIDQSRLTGLDFVCLRYLHKVSQGSTAREGAATDRLSAS